MKKAIHPHIQWGNCSHSANNSDTVDIPSHTVRELISVPLTKDNRRYTLTYSKGTYNFPAPISVNAIYPHIQWGNHESRPRLYATMRYTLTYSEGTPTISRADSLPSIYPHIQWGNCLPCSPLTLFRDIPSHTVRKPPRVFWQPRTLWYTLTYSEGTSTRQIAEEFKVIYPHIQWGNAPARAFARVDSDIPSHTVRELSVFTRLSAAPNTLLCNLHKSLLSSSSHI